MISLNDREQNLLLNASERCKQYRNAEKVETWRDGKLVDVRVTENIDRIEIKKTND